MDPATLIGGLLITIIGGVFVYFFEKWMDNRRLTKSKNRDLSDHTVAPLQSSIENNVSTPQSTNIEDPTTEEIKPAIKVEAMKKAQDVSLPDRKDFEDWPAFTSHGERAIVVTIDGTDYFLEGLNALIYASLAESSVFARQLSENRETRKAVLRNLAIVLATIDRQYSEPATISVIRALWLKEKRTGIGHFVELLSHRQWRDSRWSGYRDHLNHMLKVYLTGIYLFENCDSLRGHLSNSSENGEDEFLRRWLYTSTFHDIGYIFELTESGKVVENLKFIEEYIQNFLFYHDEELSEDLEKSGLRSKSIDRKNSREILRTIGLQFQEIQSVEDLGLVLGESENLWDQLDKACENTGIGPKGLSTYYKLGLTQSPPMLNGRPSFHDHGIIGAITLLYIASSQRAIFEQIKANLEKEDTGGRANLKTSGRIGVLSKMLEWAGNLDENLDVVKKSAVAIALHNIYKTAWRFEDLPWQVDLANYSISIDDYPLAFFLILVDILQGWDRPGFNPTSSSDNLPLRGSEIDIRSDGKQIFIGYPKQPNEYIRTLAELKTVLRPEQIDTLIAPLDLDKGWIAPSRIPNYVRHYNQNVIEKLKGDWFGRFIELYMEIPIRARQDLQSESHQYTIFEIEELFLSKPVALIGPPGAGKTTLAKKLAINHAIKGPRIPVFLNMGLYVRETNLLEMFELTLDQAQLVKMLSDGRFLIIFDGLNEVGYENVNYASRAIISLIKRYATNQYLLTCRATDYPIYLREEFREFRVLPVAPETIREYLVNVLGDEAGAKVYSDLTPRLKSLFSNPLLLTMLTYAYMSKERHVDIPGSRAALYKLFLHELYRREEGLRTIELTQNIREEFLCYIAAKLNNQSTVALQSQVEKWIQELYDSRYKGSGVNLLTTIKEVLTLPPLKTSGYFRDPDTEVSFMHQSFQEYYAAQWLMKRFFGKEMGLSEIVELASPSNEHWWETLILFVGLADDATLFIEALKDKAESVAKEQRTQQVFTLVARCVREAQFVKPSEVDDVILRTMFAMKYGTVDFDTDLFLGLKLIGPEQRSSDFPERVIQDMEWWIDKWARVSPVKLEHNIPIDVLLSYLERNDERLQIDALYTIRDHPNKEKAVTPLINKLASASGIIKEQTVAAIGFLGDAAKKAVEPLIQILQDPNESKWTKAHVSLALGRIGDRRALDALKEYTRIRNNIYRDTSSWGIYGIVKKFMDDKSLLDEVKRFYFDTLIAESKDEPEIQYTKGNLLFCLGQLKAIEYVEDIVNWLRTENDPFVIEDGIYALGHIQDLRAWDIVTEYIENEDPIVRVIAAESLVALALTKEKTVEAISHIERLLNDKIALVRVYAEKYIRVLNEKLSSLA